MGVKLVLYPKFNRFVSHSNDVNRKSFQKISEFSIGFYSLCRSPPLGYLHELVPRTYPSRQGCQGSQSLCSFIFVSGIFISFLKKGILQSFTYQEQPFPASSMVITGTKKWFQILSQNLIYGKHLIKFLDNMMTDKGWQVQVCCTEMSPLPCQTLSTRT